MNPVHEGGQQDHKSKDGDSMMWYTLIFPTNGVVPTLRLGRGVPPFCKLTKALLVLLV